MNLKKSFFNIENALKEYNKEVIKIHSYIWIYINRSNNNKYIKIKNNKTNKNLKFIM